MLSCSSALVGDCGFHVLGSEPRQVEFGISLATEFPSQGYATEALRALLDYLLVKLGKHRAVCSVDPRNVRSIALMQRVGMQQEAYSVKSFWFGGEWVDDVIFAMLGSDWKTTNIV
jgi:RimJ/RimL family protein N-acetyltransferase